MFLVIIIHRKFDIEIPYKVSKKPRHTEMYVAAFLFDNYSYSQTPAIRETNMSYLYAIASFY